MALAVRWHHATMTKNFTVRLPEDAARDAEALARVEGKSMNEMVRSALVEAVERRRADPEFKSGFAASSTRTGSSSSAWPGEG